MYSSVRLTPNSVANTPPSKLLLLFCQYSALACKCGCFQSTCECGEVVCKRPLAGEHVRPRAGGGGRISQVLQGIRYLSCYLSRSAGRSPRLRWGSRDGSAGSANSRVCLPGWQELSGMRPIALLAGVQGRVPPQQGAGVKTRSQAGGQSDQMAAPFPGVSAHLQARWTDGCPTLLAQGKGASRSGRRATSRLRGVAGDEQGWPLAFPDLGLLRKIYLLMAESTGKDKEKKLELTMNSRTSIPGFFSLYPFKLRQYCV